MQESLADDNNNFIFPVKCRWDKGFESIGFVRIIKGTKFSA
jgi:hypothetical protein